MQLLEVAFFVNGPTNPHPGLTHDVKTLRVVSFASKDSKKGQEGVSPEEGGKQHMKSNEGWQWCRSFDLRML